MKPHADFQFLYNAEWLMNLLRFHYEAYTLSTRMHVDQMLHFQYLLVTLILDDNLYFIY